PARGDPPGPQRRRPAGGAADPRRRSRLARAGAAARAHAMGGLSPDPPMIGGSGLSRLATPRPARVQSDRAGRPLAVAGRKVDAVRESWLIEDRWWTGKPLRRRYWEVVTADGRDLVVFRDLERGGWFAQR